MADTIYHPEFGDFHSSETMAQRGLEYYIPQWLASLRSWVESKNADNAGCFVNYLDRAFQKAERLDFMVNGHFERWKKEYMDIKTSAAALTDEMCR